jgi:hypothetical protein
LVQECVDAQAAIARARSLFGSADGIEVPNSATEITDAAQTATAGRDRTLDMAGGAGMPAYREMVDRSVPPLTTAATSDSALTTHLTTAAAVTTAAATQLDSIAAQTRTISAAAPTARSAAAQRAILTALRGQMMHASQIVQTSQQQASVAATQVRSLTYPKDAPASGDGVQALDDEKKKDPPPKPKPKPADDEGKKKDGDDEDGPGGYGGSWGKGKGGDTQMQPRGDEEHHWGTPTDPHEWHPSGDTLPHSGTFDDGRGSWDWQGPGRQGGAEGTQTHEGIGGHADVDAWVGKGEAKWSGDVGGHQLDATASAEGGAHAGAGGAVTEHGVSGHLDGFVGLEGGAKGTYHLGPVDLSLGAAGQAGYGGNADVDFGMEGGKFVMGGSLGAAWGLGGKISPKIAIDPKAVTGAVQKAEQWLEGLF